jgi:hypothetical protein
MKTPFVTLDHNSIDYAPIALIGLLAAILGIVMLQLLWFVKEQQLLILVFCSGLIVFGALLWRYNHVRKKKIKLEHFNFDGK